MEIGKTINNYKLDRKLGQGHFAYCLLCTKDAKEYAIKIPKHHNNQEIEDEIKILKHIGQNEYITYIIDDFKFANKHVFTMPSMSINLLKAMESKYSNGMPYDLVKSIIKQVLHGLEFIHSHGVIHTDIKLENILMKMENNDLRIKICDFGTSYIEKEDEIYDIGTTEYRSPENIIGAPMTTTNDIWAVGCVMYELLTSDYLFDPTSFLNEIIDTNSDSDESEYSEASDDSEASEMSDSDDSEASDDEENDLLINHMHLCLIQSLIGKMPKYIQKQGESSEEYFHRGGIIRNFPSFINNRNIKDLLVNEYDKSEEMAEEISEFLSHIFVYDKNKRYTATQLLEHKIFN